ncbi:hypothetical protein L3Q82_020544 [Scortum barcoo]|uniref:Uncharacterized protein n=1 Tax=Scortum barcoo TaxID=214431 RepID=A0ACB8V8Y6_9TELE|nr:hypothetical protein L3Q82_020544 [Scortum barcoo]
MCSRHPACCLCDPQGPDDTDLCPQCRPHISSDEFKDLLRLAHIIGNCRECEQAAEGSFFSQCYNSVKQSAYEGFCLFPVKVGFVGKEDNDFQDYTNRSELSQRQQEDLTKRWTMSLPPRVVHKRRATITDLPLYYSGHLLKKYSKEKEFKKYYGELRGTTLFLYKDDTQDTYTEKLDLEQLKSMELESRYQKKALTVFSLVLPTMEVQLKQITKITAVFVTVQMDSPDSGEEWRSYILTVIKKQIPSKLQLLPGQILQLQEVLAHERRRNLPMPRPPLPPRPSFLLSDVPVCFLNVTRQEAEQMLETNPEHGAIILRPSTVAKNYAVTLRQGTPRGSVMRHYRVTSTNSGFVIDLETPVTVSSLNDVLKYFLEKTEYRLHPYMPSQPYDTHIDVSPAPQCINIGSAASKTVPKAQVAPMMRSQTKEELLPPATKQEEGEYVVLDDHIPDDHNPKLVQLDGAFQDFLKLQRGIICIENDKVEGNVYQNQISEKSPSSKVQWTTERSTE